MELELTVMFPVLKWVHSIKCNTYKTSNEVTSLKSPGASVKPLFSRILIHRGKGQTNITGTN